MIADSKIHNTTVEELTHTDMIEFEEGEETMVFWNSSGQANLYYLVQCHMHAPSEHTFNGLHYDLELHLVHKSIVDGSLAVVAVYFDSDDGGDEPNELIT